jgi:hypothetical protein
MRITTIYREDQRLIIHAHGNGKLPSVRRRLPVEARTFGCNRTRPASADVLNVNTLPMPLLAANERKSRII